MRVFLPILVGVAVVTAAATPASYDGLFRRDQLQTCSDLTISNNNGDRKVVIVIDSSGSMADTDPDNLRLTAARALNDFLISNSEASGSAKPDQVAVVGFNSTAYTVFGPGDPGDPKVSQAIGTIDAYGGTFIAGGVLAAIDKISAMSGPTKDRSAIVVYTDGSDFDTSELVQSIKTATGLGIRVSFGFLDASASAQPEEVLLAVRDSKGVYATITVAAGSINFVNYVLLNGLAYQDNPQGVGDRLLAGLASTQLIDGSTPVTMKYLAEQGETANFTLVSFTGDTLNMEAKMNGQTLNSTSSASKYSSSVRKFLEVTPPGSGEIDIVVTASDSPKDGLFSIDTGSSAPIKNCTVGVTGNNAGLSAGAKAGVGVGVTAAVLGLAAAAFMAYKHFLGGGNTTAPPAGTNTAAPPGAHGETTSYNLGAEKLGPQTTTTSIPPNHTGGGFEGNLTGQGAPPGGSLAAPSPMGSPPGAPYSAVPPFVPPVMPPMSPNQTGQGGKNATQNDSGNQYQQTLGDNNGYQNNLGNQNSYQNNLGGDNGYQNNLGGDSGYQNNLGGDNGYQNNLGNQNSYQNNLGGQNNYQTNMGNQNDYQPQLGDQNSYQNNMGGQNSYQPNMGNQNGYQPNLGGQDSYQTQLGNQNGYQPQLGDQNGYQNHLGNQNGFQNNMGGQNTYQTNLGNESGGYQGHLGDQNAYQNHMGPGGDAQQQHTSSAFQGNSTDAGGSPFSDANHTGFDGGNHTNSGTTTSSPGPGPTPGGHGSSPPPPFCTVPSPPTGRMGDPPPPPPQRDGQRRHHHHEWLAPDTACEQPACPLVAPGHRCVLGEEGECGCTCRDGDCPVTKRGM